VWYNIANNNSDPWWIFSVLFLVYIIQTRYSFGLIGLIKVSPRFGIVLVSMTLSIAFLILDCLSVTSVISHALPDGLNPFWKLAFVFKCLTDTIILDDFKTALADIREHKFGRTKASTHVNNQTIDKNLNGGITKTTEVTESHENASDDNDHSITAKEIDLEKQTPYWTKSWIRRDSAVSGPNEAAH
jgi:hypothetical protein